MIPPVASLWPLAKLSPTLSLKPSTCSPYDFKRLIRLAETTPSSAARKDIHGRNQLTPLSLWQLPQGGRQPTRERHHIRIRIKRRVGTHDHDQRFRFAQGSGPSRCHNRMHCDMRKWDRPNVETGFRTLKPCCHPDQSDFSIFREPWCCKNPLSTLLVLVHPRTHAVYPISQSPR